MRLKRIVAVLQLGLVAGVSAFSSGCMSHNVSKLSAPASVRCKTLVVTPDISIGPKITGEAELTKILWFIKLGSTKYADGIIYNATTEKQTSTMALILGSLTGDQFAEVKAAAAYNACEGNESDIIIAPSYVLEATDYFLFKWTKCKVTGFSGKINGIKSAEYKDIVDQTLIMKAAAAVELIDKK